jgi:hypothetical protein
LVGFKARLREHNCYADFESLEKAGCSADDLMEALVSLHLAASLNARLRKGSSGSYDSRRIRTLVQKTELAAAMWDSFLLTALGKEVMRVARGIDPFPGNEDLLNTPQRLLSLAHIARDVHRATKKGKRPIYDEVLAGFVEYVKFKTGGYRDRKVSALVAFAVGKEEYNEGTLRVWRSKHPQHLRRARARLASQH